MLAIAAMTAAEKCKIIAIDIRSAIINVDTTPTEVEVHMKLNRVMTSMLMQFDPSYEKYWEL